VIIYCVILRLLLYHTLRIRARASGLSDAIQTVFKWSVLRFPRQGFAKPLTYPLSAALLSEWRFSQYVVLLDRIFRRTTWQVQIDLFPISSAAC